MKSSEAVIPESFTAFSNPFKFPVMQFLRIFFVFVGAWSKFVFTNFTSSCP